MSRMSKFFSRTFSCFGRRKPRIPDTGPRVPPKPTNREPASNQTSTPVNAPSEPKLEQRSVGRKEKAQQPVDNNPDTDRQVPSIRMDREPVTNQTSTPVTAASKPELKQRSIRRRVEAGQTVDQILLELDELVPVIGALLVTSEQGEPLFEALKRKNQLKEKLEQKDPVVFQRYTERLLVRGRSLTQAKQAAEDAELEKQLEILTESRIEEDNRKDALS